MKKIFSALSVLSVGPLSAQLYVPPGSPSDSSNSNIGINTASLAGSLDINTNENISVIRGNSGYIPSGLRYMDDSYTVKKLAILKGNQLANGFALTLYSIEQNRLVKGELKHLIINIRQPIITI
ncbi:hypothetical protein C1637_03440 [Chryseobacterium lactis]|uniref:Uncharacterized protein n=1 Tax=Chryseobacterium lactis TaxID=1241981 RepID=A0A3G6RUF4_CHRLC|nr:hypothetical protein [Chryseobacterium lactis]AZA81639.1 hypothetical protein EG342_06835 [Chryseobacterium lactis]AZB06637.1 hypothetical protein EG341_22955 [Chryseobacterium lactis]PNW15488.1 hypothetical protein C1637_03440 [Chryseobacterium lactis]